MAQSGTIAQAVVEVRSLKNATLFGGDVLFRALVCFGLNQGVCWQQIKTFCCPGSHEEISLFAQRKNTIHSFWIILPVLNVMAWWSDHECPWLCSQLRVLGHRGESMKTTGRMRKLWNNQIKLQCLSWWERFSNISYVLYEPDPKQPQMPHDLYNYILGIPRLLQRWWVRLPILYVTLLSPYCV